MTRPIGIGEAKTNLSQLVRRAEAGEKIVVRRGREPVARIVPLKKSGGVRGFGSMKGEIRMVSGEEMKKVDKEIERLLNDGPIFPEQKSNPDQD